MSAADRPAWLLTPADLAALRAAGELLDRLAAGELPNESDPAGAHLAAWLREVADGAGAEQ